jgi:hypothetical protein
MLRCLIIAFVFTVASCGQAAEKKLDRTFTVAPGGTLLVDAEGSTVRVSGHDGNQVIVHMRARAAEKELAGTRLDAVQTDAGVTVTMHRDRHNWLLWGNWSQHEIEVQVPRQYAVEVRTSGGSVELRDTTGIASLRTSGGSISANQVTGNTEMRTSGGSIEAESIQGDVDAATSGGSVRLVRIDGKIRAKTSGGSVHCELAGANRGIAAMTSGGSIEVSLPADTKGSIEATTSGGRVSSDFQVSSSVQERSRLIGTLNGGGEPIYARTSGGSISLRAAN